MRPFRNYATPPLLLCCLGTLGLASDIVPVPPYSPRVDPKTGFIVGGKNATSLVKNLTELNGRSIEDLERDMRPGAYSTAGFLGKEERLLDVLAEDNAYVVDKLGLTHQQLARHLHTVGELGKHRNQLSTLFTYHGRRYQIHVEAWWGDQQSPFEDGTTTCYDATLNNLDNGKALTFSLLVPFMIERYGFYEGHGTSYRVDPRDIVAVFDFLLDERAERQPFSNEEPPTFVQEPATSLASEPWVHFSLVAIFSLALGCWWLTKKRRHIALDRKSIVR